MKQTTLSSLLLGAIAGGALLLASLPGCQASAGGNLNIGGGTPSNSATPPPAGAPADADGDGVADGDDKCPDKKEDGLQPNPTDGCPSEDPDQDGILGDADKCPDKPETKNGYQDEDGCPDEIPSHVKVSGNQIEIDEEVKFVTGSAEIDHASDKLIEEIAKTLKEHPEIELIEIAGHTDSRGAPPANKTLSQKRAEAVMKELEKAGIDKARMRAMGYGPYCLKEKGDTEEVHAKNRRVEFDIIISKGEQKMEWGGCEEAKKKGIKPPALPKKK
jgi:outer membrane protein OmpA-like peptidoglycan-associated protein